MFVATGGTDLGPEHVGRDRARLAGAACAAAVVVLARRGRPWGALALRLFAALAALTYASIAWSVQPADSWVEANRTLAYLAAFGAAIALARLVPARWPAVWAPRHGRRRGLRLRAARQGVPGHAQRDDTLGRLRVPFSYWNATGLMAALGLPACLWAGARPDAGRALRALSVPAIAVLATVLMLSYSRGALIAAVIGLGCWFVLVPLRLRAALLLALGAVGAAVASGWALAHHAITHDGATLAARTSAGHTFGLVLLVVLALMRARRRGGRHTAMTASRCPRRVRRRIGIVLLVLVAMVPVAGVVGVAASSRGLTGEVSHVWNEVTSPSSRVGNNPGRIAELGNSRPLYWSEGLKVGEHALLAGDRGRRLRHRPDPLQHEHARRRPRPQLPDRDVRRLRADRDRNQPRAARRLGARGGADARLQGRGARRPPDPGGDHTTGAHTTGVHTGGAHTASPNGGPNGATAPRGSALAIATDSPAPALAAASPGARATTHAQAQASAQAPSGSASSPCSPWS